MPVATNCTVSPLTVVGVAGVTAIESKVATVTVRVTVSLMPVWVALMVTVPVATPVTTPVVEMVATLRSRLAQMAVVVRLPVELSEYVPVMLNGKVLPAATDGEAWSMATDSRVAAVPVPWMEKS